MKKFLLIGLILFSFSSCRSMMVGATATYEMAATRITPTPVPATVTPTNTPVPTSSPTPTPQKRYFTEEFDSPLTYWSILYSSGDSNQVEMRNENSELTFELSSPDTWIYAIYGGFAYKSIHVETQVENLGNGFSATGLICHYNEQEGWYEYNIFSDGNYNVLHGQWLADGIAQYTPILNDVSEYIHTGSGINTIGLDCYDNIVELSVNDKIIRRLNVEYVGLESGKVGLSMASFDEVPVILSFDWLEVDERETP